jgi:hypothetical protein
MTDPTDPTDTDPELYSVLFENDRVRVLEYRDTPGASTHRHEHPDSVMVTLSAFRRRLTVADHVREFDKPRHEATWLPAQTHVGENIGDSDTHVLFVELK